MCEHRKLMCLCVWASKTHLKPYFNIHPAIFSSLWVQENKLQGWVPSLICDARLCRLWWLSCCLFLLNKGHFELACENEHLIVRCLWCSAVTFSRTVRPDDIFGPGAQLHRCHLFSFSVKEVYKPATRSHPFILKRLNRRRENKKGQEKTKVFSLPDGQNCCPCAF